MKTKKEIWKMKEIREMKEGTVMVNSKTNTTAVVVENFGGGITIEAEVNGKKVKGHMSYAQMYDMVNNEYTTVS